MPGASGAGQESPIGDDDNEEVRQRVVRALKPVLRFYTNFTPQQLLQHPSTPDASPPRLVFITLSSSYAAYENKT